MAEYFRDAPLIYRGYVDDKRNTDNAWMETHVVHVHLSDEDGIRLQPKPDGQETADARWFMLKDVEKMDLFASHTEFVRAMLQHRKA